MTSQCSARFHWSAPRVHPHPPYEIMQLQTSIRSCEGNHYVLTVINDGAENSLVFSNNLPAQGVWGLSLVTKETDDNQNGSNAVPESPPLFSFNGDFSLPVLFVSVPAATCTRDLFYRLILSKRAVTATFVTKCILNTTTDLLCK